MPPASVTSFPLLTKTQYSSNGIRSTPLPLSTRISSISLFIFFAGEFSSREACDPLSPLLHDGGWQVFADDSHSIRLFGPMMDQGRISMRRDVLSAAGAAAVAGADAVCAAAVAAAAHAVGAFCC